MFWVRPEALRTLLDSHFRPWEFEQETGQFDGTLAHATERVFSVCVLQSGLLVTNAASVCGEIAKRTVKYRYAQRG
jgi:lipopolysaccharide biosynthesis protein